MMGEMGYEGLRFWLDLLQLVGVIALGVCTYLSNRTKANKSAIGAMDDRVDDHDRRIDVMEARLDQAPTHGDIGKIYERLSTVAERVENMTGQLEMMNRQMRMIHEHLLSRGDGSNR